MHDRHALHQVGQLADIARPVVLTQRHDRARVEADRAALLVLHARDQLAHQQRNVLDALAQRCHLDGEDVEAVVQVLAEAALLDHLLEVLVGGRDDAHIGALGLIAADSLEGALLQHAQQLDLHRQRHIADFIEEQRAPVGQLEAPRPAGDGTGERALLVAEQFAFQQLRRDRPAVDRHERPFATLGMVMQVARDHFLAGARLAEDQHAGLGVRDLLHHRPHVLDGATGAHQATEQVRLALTAPLAGLVVHFAIDLGAVQRVEQLVVAGRHLQRGQHAAAQLFGAIRGERLSDHQHREELVPGTDLLEQLAATALGADFAEQYAKHVPTGVQRCDAVPPLLAATGQVVLAKKIEDDRQVATTVVIVINQENLGFTPHRGWLLGRTEKRPHGSNAVAICR